MTISTLRRTYTCLSADLQSFREALVILQRQVDDLDELKAQHYQDIMEHEEEVWDVVQEKVCVVLRSTLDVFDRFTSKAYAWYTCRSAIANPITPTALTRSLSRCFKLFQTHSTHMDPRRPRIGFSVFFLLCLSSQMHRRQARAP